ncbi:Hypothetical protein A7982_10644 [Minicystis rosea]|nr:Hypothetical protein A7982_10644 [Minicystis rosea]
MPPTPAPNGLPSARWRWAFIPAILLLYLLAFGAARLREELLHRPTCEPVCHVLKMDYEGVAQARKSDRAVACKCVGAASRRSTIPTRFFSENAIVEWIAGELTSTLGVLFSAITVSVIVIGMLHRRRAHAQGST